ncbi:MAG: ABC transporter substrate-binding protein [Stellaceae bacterium]
MTEVRDKAKLTTLLGNYPGTAALKRGEIRSPLVEFDFADVKVPNTAFKPLVREGKYDIGELAIVTFLQAKVYGKPYVLMPAPVLARGQHHTIFYNADRGKLSPGDLAGKRVGLRAYPVTTATWVRGILAEEYGVDPDRVRWITFEDGHLAEYRDPKSATRAPAGKDPAQMLLDGELDAAILGDKAPDPRLQPLIPDAPAAERKWAERHRAVPVNHLMVVRQSIATSRPEVVKEAYRMLRESRDRLPAGPERDALPFGLEANRRALEIIIDYALKQRLIPRRFSVEELFDDTTRALG